MTNEFQMTWAVIVALCSVSCLIVGVIAGIVGSLAGFILARRTVRHTDHVEAVAETEARESAQKTKDRERLQAGSVAP
jgi:MFS superfamily sulfate permease-like transporter